MLSILEKMKDTRKLIFLELTFLHTEFYKAVYHLCKCLTQ